MIGPLGEKTKDNLNAPKVVSNIQGQVESSREQGQSFVSSGGTLSYPLDVVGNPAYNASVSFEIFHYVPAASGQEQKSHIKQAEDNSKTQGGAAAKVEGIYDDAILRQSRRGPELSEKEKAEKDEKDATNSLMSSLTSGMDFFKKPGEPTVIMNFPPSMSFVDGVQYDNAQLGSMGATAMAMMEGGATGLQAAGGALMGEIKSVADAWNADRSGSAAQIDAVRLSAARAMELIPAWAGGEKARNVVALNNRMIVNPNVRAVFRGVNIREFAFQFKLIATSPEEARAMEKIIKHFRSQIYPRAFPVSFGKAEADLGFYFPNAWKIRFNFKGGQNMHIPKIKFCYMRTFNHTINPSGGGFRKDGQPNEIDISMSFVEHETLKQKDILEGF